MDILPIDPLLTPLAAALGAARAVVLEAPPGAGKTTRVPMALFEAGTTGGREVLVAEPRRLAARLAARRVAAERGEVLGERVGYAVRFENVGGTRTRVRYVTDGVLLRRLVAEPDLPSVGLVVLDEFHERHLSTDLALLLLRRLQLSRRPDLRIVVMSATLDAEPVARYLDDCPRMTSEGARFEVSIEHLPQPDERPLAKQIVGAVRRAIREAPPGDVLVFLPGAREIRNALEALAPLAEELDLMVVPLHGDLPIEQQARAVEPAARRKVVLATNVAESSVTIDGVTAVIDSGISRVATSSPWSGLPTLATVPISQAAARQRAGRAGRTRPGVVYRLYTRGDHEQRSAHELPEVVRADLAEGLLLLHGTGFVSGAPLDWLTPPPPAALAAAERLLAELGALDGAGALSPIGRRMLELPVHPRIARVLVEGERRGIAADAALAAALLGERDIRATSRALASAGGGGATGRGPSDVEELAERFREARDLPAHRIRALGLEPRAVDAVAQTARQLRRMLRDTVPAPTTIDEREAALGLALFAGYSDRVARRRELGSRDLVLKGGEAAELCPRSVVHDARFLLALDAEQQHRGRGASTTLVRLASRIDPDWLIEHRADELREEEDLVFSAATERVERISRSTYGSLVIDELRRPAAPSPAAGRVLARAARAAAWEKDALDQLVARLALVAAHRPDLGLPTSSADLAEALIDEACAEATSFAELRSVSLTARLVATLTPAQAQALHTLAPESTTLPGGRSLSITYGLTQPPWAASRLQDFFGLAQGPSVAEGRVPLTLHLLAPNRRAVQITSDLAGFWLRHYPALRRELMRRYPKHDWPEDGATARPPPPGKLRAPR